MTDSPDCVCVFTYVAMQGQWRFDWQIILDSRNGKIPSVSHGTLYRMGWTVGMGRFYPIPSCVSHGTLYRMGWTVGMGRFYPIPSCVSLYRMGWTVCVPWHIRMGLDGKLVGIPCVPAWYIRYRHKSCGMVVGNTRHVWDSLRLTFGSLDRKMSENQAVILTPALYSG